MTESHGDKIKRIVAAYASDIDQRFPPGSYKPFVPLSADGKFLRIGVKVHFFNFNTGKVTEGIVSKDPEIGFAHTMLNEAPMEVHLDTLGPKWHDVNLVWSDPAKVRNY